MFTIKPGVVTVTTEQYTETEIKLYVPHLEVVQIRLERIGARLTAERVYERNVRYENAAKTLTERGIVVRLRQDTRVRLTYKDPADGSDEFGHYQPV